MYFVCHILLLNVLQRNIQSRAQVSQLRFHYGIIKLIFSDNHLDDLRALIKHLLFVRLSYINS